MRTVTSILDTIDTAIADHGVSPDAMRWTPEPMPPDLRPAIYRQQPAERQATWAWWCPTCQQPIPQPRWNMSKPSQFAYHLLDGTLGHHRIERRP